MAAIALYSLFSVPSYISSAALILDRLFGFWPVIIAGALLSLEAVRRVGGVQSRGRERAP